MRILVIGGTQFVGRAIVEAGLERGHTCQHKQRIHNGQRTNL